MSAPCECEVCQSPGESVALANDLLADRANLAQTTRTAALLDTLGALVHIITQRVAQDRQNAPECICPKCGVRHGGSSFAPEHPF